MANESAPDLRPLAERLRPRHLTELVGNRRARTELEEWGLGWSEAGRIPRQRAAILSGPPGVGKTSAAHALAVDLGWTVVEMNASDARNERAIELVAGRASLTHSLPWTETPTGDRRGPARTLILLDEADSLTGRGSREEATPRAAPPTLREFLRTRYGSVAALNRTWGLGTPGGRPGFTRWEELPPTPRTAAWTKLGPAQRDIADWRGAIRVPDTSDRGGLAAIGRLVRETRQPLVLTVNDEQPLGRLAPLLRTSARRIRWDPATDSEVRAFVRSVARKERIALTQEALDQIVHRTHGDLRAALNDLDAVAPLPPGPLQLEVLGGRDQRTDFVALTEEVLTRPRWYRSVEIQNRLDATPDDVLPWIEENAPRFARSPEELCRAFGRLAVAERFLSSARRARVYSLWSYSSELMTGGVSLALGASEAPAGRYVAFPQILGALGRTRSARATRDGLLRRFGRRIHLSRRKAIQEYWPWLETVFEGPRARARGDTAVALRHALVAELELTADEAAVLLGTDPNTPAVRGLLAPASATPAVEPGRAAPTRARKPVTPEPEATERGRGKSRPNPPAGARRRVQRRLD